MWLIVRSIGAFIFIILIALVNSGCWNADISQELAGGFMFHSESKNNQVIVPPGHKALEPFVPCNVTAYEWNDHHIIAKQEFTSDCFWGIKSTYKQESGKKYFWIIEAANKVIHGPLDKAQYKELRTHLKVSEKLQF